MGSVSDLLLDIAQTADELTNPIRNVERIQDVDQHRHRRASAVRRVWVAILPSLLEQLAHAVIPGESYTEDEAGRSAFESRPAARLDAVDRLLAIEAGSAMWCRRNGIELRDNPVGNIRTMVGIAGLLGSTSQATMLGDLRAWRTWAATVTGWERPPDAPRATCLHCAARNTLRVRLDRQTGCCMACGAWWDHTTIGLLAEHIRTTAEHAPDTKALRHAAVLARRDWEARRATLAGRQRPDLPYACPQCGQVRCQLHTTVSA